MLGKKPMSLLHHIQRIAFSVPVIIILSIVVWSYYAFVVALCSILPRTDVKTIYLIVYHVVFLLFIVSYLRAIFSDAGGVPPQFYLTPAEKEALDRCEDSRSFLESVGERLPVHEATLTASIRYCEVCLCIKPDRSHHCSMCRRCVLKMDHHCPWINNCVGFRNYKFFLTFLLYSCTYCLTVCLLVAPWAVFVWNKVPDFRDLPEMTKFHVMIVFFVAAMFFLAVSGLWVFHAFLTAHNKSTLEMGRSPRFRHPRIDARNPYDRGCRTNCTDVYGSGPFLLCPVYTSQGNGVLFDRNENIQGDTRHLLASGGLDSEEEETTIYDAERPLNLDPVQNV